MQVSEETLQRAEARAIEFANRIIELWGEEQGARLLSIYHGVIERKIADCGCITEMQHAIRQVCEAEKVAASRKKFLLIQGGVA